MLEINVTIKASELAEAINNLAAAMSRKETIISTGLPETSATPIVATPITTPPEAPVQTAPSVSPLPDYSDINNTVAPPPTIEALSRAGAELCEHQDKMPQLIALLGKYGVQTVTQLNGAEPDKLIAFAAELRALGANI